MKSAVAKVGDGHERHRESRILFFSECESREVPSRQLSWHFGDDLSKNMGVSIGGVIFTAEGSSMPEPAVDL